MRPSDLHERIDRCGRQRHVFDEVQQTWVSLKALQLSIIHGLEWLNVIFDSLIDDGVKRFLFVNISRLE